MYISNIGIVYLSKWVQSNILTLVVGLFLEDENETIFPEANFFVEGNFLRLSINIGAKPVISPNESNSFELKKRREIPGFEVRDLLFKSFFRKEPFTFLKETLVDKRLKWEIYESTSQEQAIPK